MKYNRLIIAGVVLASASAASAVTIVDAANTSSGSNLRYTRTGNTVGTLVSTTAGSGTTPLWVNTNLTFANNTLNTVLGTIAAQMRFTATVTGAAQSFFGTVIQPLSVQSISGGLIEFRSLSALTVGQTDYAAHANLLTASFTGGAIVGSGTAASLIAATTGGSNFTGITSDFLTFNNSTSFDLNLGLASLTNPLSFTAGRAVNSFAGKGSASFTSDAPGIITATIPEPEAWVLFVVGFGLVGAFRRRKSAVVAV